MLDRAVSPAGQTAVHATIAEAIAHPANGLADVRLRSVMLAARDGVVTVNNRAD